MNSYTHQTCTSPLNFGLFDHEARYYKGQMISTERISQNYSTASDFDDGDYYGYELFAGAKIAVWDFTANTVSYPCKPCLQM